MQAYTEELNDNPYLILRAQSEKPVVFMHIVS